MKRIFSLIVIFSLLIWGESQAQQDEMLHIENGKVRFTSNAPLESISASSTHLKGLMTLTDNRFAFTVDVNSFEGFNSALQRDHFNENYMETSLFPKASFKGKIIDKIDFSKNGTIQVRAKGILNIHGVSKERIITVVIEIQNGAFKFNSHFNIPLTDHNITVPKIVYQKIAQVVNVEVSGDLVR